MNEENTLGYWHYVYELENYFSEIIVGQGVNTSGWTLKDYAVRWVEQDIEGHIMWLNKDWSANFKNGVILAHKDFKEDILNYRIEQDIKYYGYLKV